MIGNGTTSLKVNSRNFMSWRPYLIILLFSITFLVYGPLLRKHYAFDTYSAEAYGNQGNAQIRDGRFLSGIVIKVFTALGVSTVAHQSYLTFLSLCLLTLSIYLLIRLYFGLVEEWDAKSLLLLCLSCVVSLCNVFILHWFLYPDVVVFMMTGLLLSIMAVHVLKWSGAKKWFLCYILILVSLSFYQAASVFFVIFGMLFVSIQKARQSVASTLKEFGILFLTYGFAGISNMLFIKWISTPTSRTDFYHSNPLNNIISIIDNLKMKLENTNLGTIPVYTFILLVFFLFVFSIMFLWRSSDRKGLWQTLCILSILIVGSFAAVFAPHLLTSAVNMSPRSIVALMSLPCVISLFLLFQKSLFGRPMFSRLLLGFLLVFFFVNTYITYSVEISRFATNRLDKEIAKMICLEIMQHEKETGNTIKKIAAHRDESPTLCYPGLVCYGNFRAMGENELVVPIISIVSGRSFNRANMPDDIYNSFFKGKDWNLFNKEQIMFQGDTLYLMLY